MNWTNIWMSLFGTTSLFGLDMGFWVAMAVVVVIVIAMNVIFWSMKPKKYSQPSTMNTKNNLLETITEGT